MKIFLREIFLQYFYNNIIIISIIIDAVKILFPAIQRSRYECLVQSGAYAEGVSIFIWASWDQ